MSGRGVFPLLEFGSAVELILASGAISGFAAHRQTPSGAIRELCTPSSTVAKLRGHFLDAVSSSMRR
jgi:hypothetical protein